jgi:hypothetical protein
LGEDILDRADRLTLLREEHVLTEADVPLDLGEVSAGTGLVLEAVGGSPLEGTTQVQTPTGKKAGSGADNIGPMMGTSEGTADKQTPQTQLVADRGFVDTRGDRSFRENEVALPQKIPHKEATGEGPEGRVPATGRELTVPQVARMESLWPSLVDADRRFLPTSMEAVLKLPPNLWYKAVPEGGFSGNFWLFTGNFWLFTGVHDWWGKQNIHSRQISIRNNPAADRRGFEKKMSENSGVYKCLQNGNEPPLSDDPRVR